MFIEFAKPEHSVKLPPEEKRVLRQWLSTRYGRPAFPNAFENRLKKNKTKDKLDNILKPMNPYLVGIFFDLGLERTIELPDEQPYYLRISIVYDAIQGLNARQVAEDCAIKMSELFNTTYGDPANATDIALESCQAVADTHISIADLRKVDQWRAEYISLRETPPSPFLAAGEIVP